MYTISSLQDIRIDSFMQFLLQIKATIFVHIRHVLYHIHTMKHLKFKAVVVSMLLSLSTIAQNLDWAIGISAQFPGGIYYIPANVNFDIELNSSQDVYTCGYAYGEMDFDFSSSNALDTLIGPSASIIKYDSGGNYLWHITFDDTAAYGWDRCRDIEMTANGSVLVTGEYYGSPDVDPSTNSLLLPTIGGGDIFFGKYSSSGNLIWMKAIGNKKFDRPYAIREDAAGNIYLAGRFDDTLDVDPSASVHNIVSQGLQDAYVAKYDASGNFLSVFTFGGQGDARITNLEIAPNRELIVSGHFSNTVDFNPGTGVAQKTSNGNLDFFLARYDSLGGFKWVQTIGDTADESNISMDLTSTGDILLTGEFHHALDLDPGTTTDVKGSVGGHHLFLAKYTGAGQYMWGETFGSPVWERIGKVKAGPNDLAMVSGVFRDTAIFDTDTVISLGGSDHFAAVFADSAELVDLVTVGSSADDWPGASILGAGNRVFMTGSIQSQTDFDPSNGTFNITPDPGMMSVFIAKYSPCVVTEFKDSVCYGQYYVFPNGDSSDVSVVHTSVVSSQNSCDSVVVIDLRVQGGVFPLSDSICFGDVYTFPDGKTSSVDTVHDSHFTTNSGCDSTVRTSLNVINLTSSLSQVGQTLHASNGSADLYTWIRCEDNVVEGTSSSPVFAPSQNGRYKVRLQKGGCSFETDCFDFFVDNVSEFAARKNLVIYPNPSNGIIHIETETEDILEISVYNSTGSQVFQQQYADKSIQFDLTNGLSNGMYLIRIRTADQMYSEMILLER